MSAGTLSWPGRCLSRQSARPKGPRAMVRACARRSNPRPSIFLPDRCRQDRSAARPLAEALSLSDECNIIRIKCRSHGKTHHPAPIGAPSGRNVMKGSRWEGAQLLTVVHCHTGTLPSLITKSKRALRTSSCPLDFDDGLAYCLKACAVTRPINVKSTSEHHIIPQIRGFPMKLNEDYEYFQESKLL